jgi:hypothetical protein
MPPSRRLTPEHAARRAAAEAEAWGVEREPFQPDGAYFAKIAAHWKAKAEAQAPGWARGLTDDDEWVVRTALANVASDLDRALSAIPPDDRQPVRRAITDSIRRYKDTLERIEEHGV